MDPVSLVGTNKKKNHYLQLGHITMIYSMGSNYTNTKILVITKVYRRIVNEQGLDSSNGHLEINNWGIGLKDNEKDRENTCIKVVINTKESGIMYGMG